MAVEQLVLFNAFMETDVMNESDWTSNSLGALLLRNDGPGLGAEWFARSLSDKREPPTVLSLLSTYQAVELSSTGYSRQSLTPNQIVTIGGAVDRGEWRVAESSLLFGSNVGDAEQQKIEGILVYIGSLSPASDGTNIPIIMQEYATGRQTANSPVGVDLTNQTLWWKLQA